jgi:actin-related protein 8
LADPHEMGYVVRWPLYGGHFNARDYPSNQVVLSDIEAVLRDTLSESLSIDPKSYNVRFHLSVFPPWDRRYHRVAYSWQTLFCLLKDYSAVLVIPDFYERTYVKDLIDILLLKMGFKQICVQQASPSPPPLLISFPSPETLSFP